MTETEKQNENLPNAWWKSEWLLLIPVLVAAVLLVVAYGRAFPKFNNWMRDVLSFREMAAWGQLGDYMGGILNPLISTLTLYVAISVWRLQKKELEETRQTLAEQGKTAERQRREQRFFDLLGIYTEALNAIGFTEKFEESRVHHKGKHAFRFLVSSYKSPLARVNHAFEQPSQWGDYLTSPTEPTNLSEEWQTVSPLLEHYFRTTTLVLNELDLLFPEEDDRRRYGKLLRTQLSSDEVFLVAMNLLYSSTGHKMKDVVIKFGLLKHIPPSYLRTIAERELDARSFGNNWACITIEH